MDDILVKSTKETDHITDLEEAFNNLHHYRMRFNPNKCIFNITAGKFLGFMVTRHGIEANPKKIQTILNAAPNFQERGLAINQPGSIS